MNDDAITLDHVEDTLDHDVSDEALEAAADAAAMSYTYQTSAYNRCCR